MSDPSQALYALMYPKPGGELDDPGDTLPGGNTSVVQAFTLDDRSSQFPASDSHMEVYLRYDGECRLVASDEFGAANQASVALQDDTTYCLIRIVNDAGDSRDIGQFEYDADGDIDGDGTANENDTIRLIVSDTGGEDPGEETNDPPVPEVWFSPKSPNVSETVEFNAHNSTDPDGQIVRYLWDENGDGLFEAGTFEPTGPEFSKAFTSGGNYTVTLRVRDDDGAERDASVRFYIYSDNEPPVAQFSINDSNPTIKETLQFDASASYDNDGSISSYSWDVFDNGSETGTGSTINYNFSSAGTYLVTLTVTDNGSDTDSLTKAFVVAVNSSEANEVPSASIATNVSNPDAGDDVEFDGSGSSDSDGSIATYEWDVDQDGTYELSGQTAVYAFQSNGSYDVILRVTDDEGSQATATTTVTVGGGEPSAPPNAPPDATFSYSPSSPEPGESITFNASNSSDPEGGTLTYEWDFDGDGTTDATGVTADRSLTEGVYYVVLRVTDNRTLFDEETKRIVVGEPGRSTVPYDWHAEWVDENESDDNASIKFRFAASNGSSVSDFELKIYPLGDEDNPVFNRSYGSIQSLTYSHPLSADQLDKQWVLEWSATIEGREVKQSLRLGANVTRPGLPIDQQWLGAILLVFLTFIPALYSGEWATYGALGLVVIAGVLMAFAMIDIPTFAWWTAAAIAVGGHIRRTDQQGVRN